MEQKLELFRERIGKIFVGKQEVTELVLCAFLAGGHILLEDVPGVGKTTLARAFASLCSLSFGRIQFTPDTMPSDVTGLSVYNMKTGEFEMRKGAVMKNLILADELNRTSPKTQAALLEAMAESQVTVDGTSYALPDPFMVIATQNPMGFTGTFPLPEAQMDRFMMRLSIGYPSQAQELSIARMHLEKKTSAEPEAVFTREEILALREQAGSVEFRDNVLSYAEAVVKATRVSPDFSLGASPRGLLHLTLAARARAFLQGRAYVTPDDIKSLAIPVLSHRLIPSMEAKLKSRESADILRSLVLTVKVPME